jgi:hypothetical protein
VSAEATVISVAAAIYLFDCVVLLERGQALWSRGRLSFGSIHYQLRGKVVALLNPFTPFIPVFRTLPLFSESSNVRLSRVLHSLMPIAALSLLQFVLLFAALPFSLLRAPGWPFFVSLALAYVNAIAMLGVIWWRFRRAGVANCALMALGFAWLACLPLSVNAVRKAGLAFNVATDARRAIRLLPAGERQRARGDLAAQVAEAMHEVDEGGESYLRLSDLGRQLAAEAGNGRI